MKRTLLSLLIVSLLSVFALTITSAATVEILACKAGVNMDGFPVVWVGYSSDGNYSDVTIAATLRNNGPVGAWGNNLEQGQHPRSLFYIEFNYDEPVEVEIYSDEVDAYRSVTADVPDCVTVGTGQPDGAFETVTVWDVQGETFTWEIQDAYGNWNIIDGIVTPLQCENERCFTRLVLGANGDTDAGHYRVTAVK